MDKRPSPQPSPSPQPPHGPAQLHIQQQPQGGWQPNVGAAPFYPGAFQFQPQQPQQSPQAYPQQQQQAYFDPAQAQMAAQWAYQQAFYAQQHGFPPHNPGMFNNPFPSGTPPPPPQNGYNNAPGFHPYRRPTNPNTSPTPNGRPTPPPYARPDAAGSSSSLSSGERQRTNSNNSSRGRNNASPPVSASSTPPPPRLPHHRSTSSSSSSNTTTAPSRPAHRPSPSSSSSTATTTTTATKTAAPSSPASATSSTASPTPRMARPSPLSQGTIPTSEKRMSRDDSELNTFSPQPHNIRGSGLRSRLRRALAFNPDEHAPVKEETDDEGATGVPSTKGKASAQIDSRPSIGGSIASPDVDDGASTATRHTKKRSRSLFNMRMNASTDNISLSSTVSSASVMIRKLGSMGKLARRNSLAGITSLFKDKDKDGDESKKSKKKDKTSKGHASEPSVSMYTAEVDRAGEWSAAEVTGLSPAARLARQHTLKSNAEAAAKAEAKKNEVVSVPAWEKNTTTGHGSSPVKGGPRVNEDGTRAFADDVIEEEQSEDGHYGAHPNYHPDGWDEDEEWEGEQDEDLTIRIGTQQLNIGDTEDDVEPWATDLRRSDERARRPAKGILKGAGTYDQQNYLDGPARTRSNSYNSPAAGQSEMGPLAHGAPADPDHIDGLHRHSSTSSSGNSSPSTITAAPSLPPLSFDSSLSGPMPRLSIESPADSPMLQPAQPQPERPSSIFNHPALNSSAPALSTLNPQPPALTHRSATAPSKRLVFANNLSVYDTFSANAYDRRSEPATWSRLTPALAQRIKEELNSYKMEEMEVHASSRIHTQFFV